LGSEVIIRNVMRLKASISKESATESSPRLRMRDAIARPHHEPCSIRRESDHSISSAKSQSGLTSAATVLAFTLIELLTVLAIIGLITAVALPSLKGLMKSNALNAATRQLLDDVAYARQKAMNDHTKVYIVFIPPAFWMGPNFLTANTIDSSSKQSHSNLNELVSGQYTSYALYSERSIGDQPGRDFPRYFTKWRQLPDGIIIETNKFSTNSLPERIVDVNKTNSITYFNVRPFAITNIFVFPPTEVTNGANRAYFWLPYIGFDARGKLLPRPGESLAEDEYIPLARGSLFVDRDDQGFAKRTVPADVQELNYRKVGPGGFTNYTLVHIEPLTGRAKIERQELK
jgi:prepilin-type N-terminal cleavage/methylation domain-containing protein